MIPQFYFPGGKPLAKEDKDKTEIAIQKAFEAKTELKQDEFEQITDTVFEIPKIFRTLLFDRIKLVEKLVHVLFDVHLLNHVYWVSVPILE